MQGCTCGRSPAALIIRGEQNNRELNTAVPFQFSNTDDNPPFTCSCRIIGWICISRNLATDSFASVVAVHYEHSIDILIQLGLSRLKGFLSGPSPWSRSSRSIVSSSVIRSASQDATLLCHPQSSGLISKSLLR